MTCMGNPFLPWVHRLLASPVALSRNAQRGALQDRNRKRDAWPRLFWNGEVMLTKSKLSLNKFQLTLAVLATIGTLAAGVHPFLDSFGIL